MDLEDLVVEQQDTEPQAGAAFQALNENQTLYYHKLGTPQSEDELVYRTPEHPRWTIGGSVTATSLPTG